MQIVLSPAKLMDFDGADDSVKATDPLFTDKTAELVAVCREMSVDEIAASMNINPQMAHDVFGYFQTFDLPVAPPGVQTTSTSSMGGNTNVTIRGVGSITGSNQPLIVIDGVPMATVGDSDSKFGDAAGDINPEDIESVTVLSGGAATAPL